MCVVWRGQQDERRARLAYLAEAVLGRRRPLSKVGEQPYFSDAARRAFMTTGSIPSTENFAWIACLAGAHCTASTIDYKIIFTGRRKDTGAERTAEGYCSTISIGALVSQFLVLTSMPGLRPRLTEPDTYSRQLWPPSSPSVDWPPDLALTIQGHSQFIDRWRPENMRPAPSPAGS